jgi:hypothetical protein
MRSARRLVTIVAALLQLALPLAGYAQAPTPFVPGEGDVCSVAHPRTGNAPAAPARSHDCSHCALCTHGAPPALTASTPLPPVVAVATIRARASGDFAPILVAHARADARAPPMSIVRPA